MQGFCVDGKNGNSLVFSRYLSFTLPFGDLKKRRCFKKFSQTMPVMYMTIAHIATT